MEHRVEKNSNTTRKKQKTNDLCGFAALNEFSEVKRYKAGLSQHIWNLQPVFTINLLKKISNPAFVVLYSNYDCLL